MAPLGADAETYDCFANQSCMNDIGCSQLAHLNKVIVDETNEVMVFRPQSEGQHPDIQFTLMDHNDETLFIGLRPSKGSLATSAFTLFKNMEFIMTNIVMIDGPNKKKAVGVIVSGFCNQVTS